jgi:uncharacterized OB-fold protein
MSCGHIPELRCGRCGNIKIVPSANCWYCGHNWFVTRKEIL